VTVDFDFADLVELAFHREIVKDGIKITVKLPLLPEVVIDPAENSARVSFSLDKSENVFDGYKVEELGSGNTILFTKPCAIYGVTKTGRSNACAMNLWSRCYHPSSLVWRCSASHAPSTRSFWRCPRNLPVRCHRVF